VPSRFRLTSQSVVEAATSARRRSIPGSSSRQARRRGGDTFEVLTSHQRGAAWWPSMGHRGFDDPSSADLRGRTFPAPWFPVVFSRHGTLARFGNQHSVRDQAPRNLKEVRRRDFSCARPYKDSGPEDAAEQRLLTVEFLP
jgi:hypothetical protein